MSRPAGHALMKALTDYLGPIEVAASTTRDWASATFVGAHHDLAFTVSPDMACRVDALPEIDLPMADHFVADLRMVAVAPRDDRLHVVIEVLTIEER